MPYKDRTKERESRRKSRRAWSIKNPEEAKKRRAASWRRQVLTNHHKIHITRKISKANHRLQAQAIIDEAKSRGCSKCGYNRCFTAIEFHHRDRKTKRRQISDFKQRYSLQSLRDEIAKCDILCANCHRAVEEEIGLIGLPTVRPEPPAMPLIESVEVLKIG